MASNTDNSLPDALSATTRCTADQAEVMVFDSRQSMGEAAAHAIGQQMQQAAELNGSVRMIFAAAPSQLEVLQTLTALPDLPWSSVTAFHMDDYVGLPSNAPQRFANWLDEHLFSRVALGQVHRIPHSGGIEQICREYTLLLNSAPVDIVCLGIGVNGHIAFNDPPVADFNDPESVKVVELDEVCRQQQVDDGCFSAIDEVPTQALTLTIPRLLEADQLFCTVSGAYKRNAVKAALLGPITTDCPASILRSHGNCKIFLDPEASPYV